MKSRRLIIACIVLVAANAAWARHTHFNFAWSSPWWPYYTYPPYPQQQTIIVERPATPLVNIEKNSTADAVPADNAADATQNFWYYCAPVKRYYPYVKQCPSGWERVSPTPADLK